MGCQSLLLIIEDIESLVKNNKNGWIIAQQEVEEFAKKIKLLAKDMELKNMLGLNGRKMIVSTYSTTKILEEKSRIYKAYMGELKDTKWAVPIV